MDLISSFVRIGRSDVWSALGLLHSTPDSSADWFAGRSGREHLYSTPQSYDESDLDLSHTLGVHALIDNIITFVSGDVCTVPTFKEPEESMSTSPQATVVAMEKQQSRAEVRTVFRSN